MEHRPVRHAIAVEERAVGAADVLDPPTLRVLRYEGMPGRRKIVPQHHVITGVAPDRVHRAKRKPLTPTMRVRWRADDDEVREPAFSGRGRPAERALQGADALQQER